MSKQTVSNEYVSAFCLENFPIDPIVCSQSKRKFPHPVLR